MTDLASAHSPGPVTAPTSPQPASADRPLLEFVGVNVSYSTYRALFDVSFTVPKRGIVALLGSNGAGKSTVARVASGLVPVTSGTIRFDDKDITGVTAHKIAHEGLAHVPEGRGVFASLTVDENLTLAFRQKVGRRGVQDACERAFTAFPALIACRRQLGGTLSGGQQRMLSLARVLAVPPRLLIVDELSLGLAPVVIDSVYDGLLAVRESGCAILVVEQQVDRALAIAETAVLLAHGSVAWTGPATEAASAMDKLLSHRTLSVTDDKSESNGHTGATLEP
ncbi:MAG TPA: ABC transporter ATP-binding protein [Acidimicrobiales bacterium]|nr:ABC transporter ATP-binding protein [Acidimicrobiales bacterium]